MVANTLDAIVCCPVFAGLAPEALAAIAARGAIHRLERRQALLHQGDEAGELSVVVSGRLKLTQVGADGQEVIVRYVGPGEMCALVALFTGQVYPVTAEAVVDARVISWPRAALERYPGITAVFVRRGMACVGCDMALFDTILDAARVYQQAPADLTAELDAAARRAETGPDSKGEGP